MRGMMRKREYSTDRLDNMHYNCSPPKRSRMCSHLKKISLQYDFADIDESSFKITSPSPTSPWYPLHHNEKDVQSSVIDQYRAVEVIGRGSFGKIARICRISDGNDNLVWKELHYGKMSDFEKKQIVSEVNILRTLSLRNHPNIVRYHDRIIDTANCKVFIVMEHCTNGDLGGLIQSHREAGTWTNESFIWKMLGQISSALAECHCSWRSDDRDVLSIIHRDLKPANILLDRSMNVKLCDFGLATGMSTVDKSNGGKTDLQIQRKVNVDPFEIAATVSDEVIGEVACGTPLYMAPERIKYCRYDERSDVWSLGCIIYELASLRHPFEAEDERELAAKISTEKLEEIPKCYSNELNNTCSWMLRRDVQRRPRVEDILRLPQLQLTLREIGCLMHENEISLKRATLQQQYDRYVHRMQEKENELKQRDARLKNVEKDLRAREQRLLSWEHATGNITVDSQTCLLFKETSDLVVPRSARPIHLHQGSHKPCHIIEPNALAQENQPIYGNEYRYRGQIFSPNANKNQHSLVSPRNREDDYLISESDVRRQSGQCEDICSHNLPANSGLRPRRSNSFVNKQYLERRELSPLPNYCHRERGAENRINLINSRNEFC